MNIIKQPMLPNTIHFHHTMSDDRTEVMRITRDGVWVNPNMSVDDAAQAVLKALDSQIKVLVDAAVAAEREACAQLLDEMAARDKLSNYYAVAAKAIRARGQQ